MSRTRNLSGLARNPQEARVYAALEERFRELDRRLPKNDLRAVDDTSKRPAAEKNKGARVFVGGTDRSAYVSDGDTWRAVAGTTSAFAVPTLTYGTTATIGSATSVISHDARIKFPTALMSSANSSTLTLTDDATDQTLTGSLGTINLRPAGGGLSLPKWTGGGESVPTVGTVLQFSALSSTIGDSIQNGVVASVAFNSGTQTVTGTASGGSFTLDTRNAPAYTALTAQALYARLHASSIFSSSIATFTARYGGFIQYEIPRQSGTGTVTVTDTYGLRVDNTNALNSAVGTYTNAYGVQADLPACGATIRRGFHLLTGSVNIGTESANTEGFYCEDLTKGTAQRASFYSEGATAGTPTDVYAFFQGTAHAVGTNRYGARFTGATTGTPTLCVGIQIDAHAVGTTKYSIQTGVDPSLFGGNILQIDNVKHVLGTGVDAEIYYDGTDLILDPDVVGTGSVRHKGATALEADTTITDAKNIIVGTGTGTKIGTATTQLLGFWNAAPVVQPTAAGTASSWVAGAGLNAVLDKSTFTGSTGATAYTIDDLIKSLKIAGLIKT